MTESLYDQWHAAHPTGQGPWYEMARTLLTRTPTLLRDSQVLEIGCGQGDFSAWMATQGVQRVVGEDFSATAVEHAKRSHQAPQLSFGVGDIEAIAHADGAFDLVVSCETVEHVPHPARAVRELARVLRPGGTLILSTPNYLSIIGLYRLYLLLRGRKWDEGGQPLVNWTMHPRTITWIKRAGLSIESTQGDIWNIPVYGRAGKIDLHPPAGVRPWVKLSANHIVIEARK